MTTEAMTEAIREHARLRLYRSKRRRSMSVASVEYRLVMYHGALDAVYLRNWMQTKAREKYDDR